MITNDNQLNWIRKASNYNLLFTLVAVIGMVSIMIIPKSIAISRRSNIAEVQYINSLNITIICISIFFVLGFILMFEAEPVMETSGSISKKKSTFLKYWTIGRLLDIDVGRWVTKVYNTITPNKIAGIFFLIVTCISGFIWITNFKLFNCVNAASEKMDCGKSTPCVPYRRAKMLKRVSYFQTIVITLCFAFFLFLTIKFFSNI